MKLSLFILAMICITSTAFSNEPEDLYLVETPQIESAQAEPQISPFAYTYFKTGSSILYQNIGFGKRFTDFAKESGHDWAWNIKAPLLMTREAVFTSIEYTYLFYKSSQEHTDYYSYSGIGLEVGTFIGASFRYLPIPNPKIIWGKQYTNHRFSQWSLNLLPAVLCVASAASLAHSTKDGALIMQFGLVALGVMFEYSVGF